MTKKEINASIKEYKEYQLMKKQLEDEMNGLKEKLIKHMDSKKIEELEASEGKVIFKHNILTIFNQDLFKEEHSKLFEKYKVPTERPYFRVV